MNRPNETTPLTAKALIPLGALAVAAGCGGGGGSPALPPQQPAANTPNASKHAMTTAMLTIAIPARGPKATSSAKRAPKYISQGSAAIGVTVATAGAPAPAETVFPLPSPAPQATTTTLPVTAPLGTDTVSVNVYDAVPTAKSVPNVLSKGTTTATIATGSTQLSVQALGVAAGVQLAAGGSSMFTVLQNHPQPQSTTVAATPVDADGYAIAGNLASPVPLTAPAGVTVSPSTISAAGTLTATYAASQTAPGGPITAGLPLDVAPGSTDDLTVAATQYLFVTTSSATMGVTTGALSVIDPVAGTVVANITLPQSGPYSIAAIAGCASGETAVVAPSYATGAVTTALTLAPPATGRAPVTTDLTGVIQPRALSQNGVSPSYFASDANCGMYSANDATLTRYSGFPAATGTPVGATGWTANSSLAVQGNTIYGLTETTSGPTGTGVLQSVPLTGGPATTIGTAYSNFVQSDFGMEVGGVNVYELNTGCSGSYLTTVPANQTTQVSSGINSVRDFAVAPNGTVYLLSDAASGGRTYGRTVSPFDAKRDAAARARVAFVSPTVTPPPGVVSLTGNAAAVTADGRFLVVGTSGAGTTPASVQVYAIPSAVGASPSPIGSPIPLPSAQPVVGRLVFPR